MMTSKIMIVLSALVALMLAHTAAAGRPLSGATGLLATVEESSLAAYSGESRQLLVKEVGETGGEEADDEDVDCEDDDDDDEDVDCEADDEDVECDDDELELMAAEDGPMPAEEEDAPMPAVDGDVASREADVPEDDVMAPAPTPDEDVMETGDEECQTVGEMPASVPDLSMLSQAIAAAAEVGEDLNSLTEDFTVFAPSDAAFDVVPKEAIDALLNHPEALTYILELHVVPGAYFAEDLMDGDVLETLNGQNLTVSVMNDTVTITAPDDGTYGVVTSADTDACNGVIHVIDSILVPGIPSDAEGPGVTADAPGPDSLLMDIMAPEPAVEKDGEEMSPEPMPETDPLNRATEVQNSEAPMPSPEEVMEQTDAAPEPMAPVEDSAVDTESAPMNTGMSCVREEDNDKDLSGNTFEVCLNGEMERFGPTSDRKPAGVVLYHDGKCMLEEYAGGFDGYPSAGINDGHEKELDEAIIEMFPGDLEKQTDFLQDMIKLAKCDGLVNLDYPEDKEEADNGARMTNINWLSDACSELITITSC